MIGKPRPGRYCLHGLDSPEGEAVLLEQGLTRADLERALAELERSEGIRIRSIVGINHDGVFGTTREGWHPDLPDACKEPFVPLLWIKIQELLGRVPKAAPRASSMTALCRTDRSDAPELRCPTVGIAFRPLHGMFGVRRRDGDGFYARCRQWLPRQIPPSRRPASTADWAPRLIAV